MLCVISVDETTVNMRNKGRNAFCNKIRYSAHEMTLLHGHEINMRNKEIITINLCI
jgi:hypothetical protein